MQNVLSLNGGLQLSWRLGIRPSAIGSAPQHLPAFFTGLGNSTGRPSGTRPAGPNSKSDTGFGCHGSSKPLGSAFTAAVAPAPLASLATRLKSESKIASLPGAEPHTEGLRREFL